MIKQCHQCTINFEITSEDEQFFDRISPVIDGKKYLIPTPSFCASCRERRRMSYRNDRKLYKRKSNASGSQIISIYSEAKPHKIYSQDEWWGEGWDAMEYGRDYDFNRSFFDQFGELMLVVPRLSSFVVGSENSEYTNGAAYNKDCYLIFVSDHNEDCCYSEVIFDCKYCFDSLDLSECELCYEGISGTKCYGSKYFNECHNCTDVSFCYDMKNCSSCFGCAGLRNKNYCIGNKQYTREEYLEKIKTLYKSDLESIMAGLEMLKQYSENIPRLFIHGVNNIDSTGDYISNCKGSKNVYSCHYVEDCENVINGNKIKDCREAYSLVDDAELSYEVISADGPNKCSFILCCYKTNNNLIYCDHCIASKDLLGCIGLKHKQYCIFNKQYTKEEYEALVPKIIEQMQASGQWGEFFPAKLSPFGYNETVASIYHPLTKEEALSVGFNWAEENTELDFQGTFYEPKEIDYYKDPSHHDELFKGVLKCEVSGKPFRVIPQELAFLIKMDLPIPRLHPDERYKQKLSKRNPKKLWNRNCMCQNSEHKDHLSKNCEVKFMTTYSPDRSEKVFCEECYQNEVY